ncbi:programmed cell death protein 2 [Clohesyomyces aquaticus]|uniref:Programmed cell death protein 2 n=1 Tax=Clohesyomyces aquaticus TaxID=1231657 RepID=A0A1Y1ZRA7_9PLEO|nr:programmed cell death protein 2 [Clohesyomyces aquaticus]
MPPYESESSDEGEDYTETNVLLGYASQEATSDTVSHLGGYPTWIQDNNQPSGALAKCRVCNDFLSLLLQLNGELPEHFPGHDRRLYMFTCRRRTCRRKEGSVRAIRAVRVAKGGDSKAGKPNTAKPASNETKEERKPQTNIGESLFGVKNTGSTAAPANPFANPFASNTNGKAPVNPFSAGSAAANPFAKPSPISSPARETLPETFASKVRLSSPPPTTQPPRPHEPWPAQSSFPHPYPEYHLDAEYETLEASSTPQIPSNARMEIDAEGSGAGGKEDKEVFESTIDKTFQKFADRVGQNPEQVLRYEFKGKPLLYSDNDAVGKMLHSHSEHGSASNAKVMTTGSKGGIGMPRCQNCGAERAFEVQLTPHAITELEADEMGIEGMEWGTIIMGVCTRDCKPSDVAEGDVGYLEEWCGVQWEEIASKR